MPVDTSMYSQSANPLATLGSAAGIANALAQNRVLNTEGNLLSGEYQGNLAVGQAYQNNLNPDGTVNIPALNRAIGANPAAAYGAPQAYQGTANLQGTNLQNQQSGVTQSQGRMNDFYSSGVAPLLNDPTNPPTRAQILSTAAQWVHAGRLLPQDLAVINNEVPLDKKGVLNYAQTKAASILPSGGTSPSPVATGVTPLGQQTQGTQGQVQRLQTTPLPVGVTAQRGQPPQPPGIVNTLPVGATDNINALNADLQASAAKTGNIRNLTTALPMMEQLGASGAGPTSENLAQARSLFQTLGIIGQSDTDPNVVRDKIGKYLDKYIGNAPASQRSDMAQSLQNMSSPNLNTAMAATIDLAKSAVGFDRMDAAAPILFQKSGLPPSQYLTWKAGFPSSQDPRAYNFELMSPQEKQDIVKGLGKPGSPAYQKFLTSLQNANLSGMIPPPSPQGAANAGQ